MSPSHLPGVNPATLNEMLLYYRLMTKWSGLGDSTELSRVGLSQPPRNRPFRRARRCISLAHDQDRRIYSGRTPSVRSTVDPCTGITARFTARARIHGRWIWDPRFGCGDFLKELLSFCGIASRSFHLIRILQQGPEIYKLAPVYPG
jgi:hypothetical protein